MERQLQRKVMAMFHYALKPEGFLQLGHSEGVGADSQLFKVADMPHRLFSPRPFASRAPFYSSFAGRTKHVLEAGAMATDAASPELQKEVDSVMLARYGPPGVVVDQDLEILHFRGKTSP